MATNADPSAGGWCIRDRVIRLRVVGTDTAFALEGASSLVVGAAPECAIRLDDPSGRVSRRHAAIELRGEEWGVSDLESTNGIRQDGEKRSSFVLTPGMEIGIGGLKLVAESQQSLALRTLLIRFIGVAEERIAEVDSALQAARAMANLRAVLIIRGDGPLVGVARRIHEHVLGTERALVAHLPGEPGVPAMARAATGTLYLEAERLPKDIREVVVGLRLPSAAVRLVVGANNADAAAEFSALVPAVASITVPKLAGRDSELDAVLQAYAMDAAAVLGVSATGLRPHDLQWIRNAGVTSHAEIDEVMMRVVAARNFGMSGGAERLGITHSALGRYLRRRGIPT